MKIVGCNGAVLAPLFHWLIVVTQTKWRRLKVQKLIFSLLKFLTFSSMCKKSNYFENVSKPLNFRLTASWKFSVKYFFFFKRHPLNSHLFQPPLFVLGLLPFHQSIPLETTWYKFIFFFFHLFSHLCQIIYSAWDYTSSIKLIN